MDRWRVLYPCYFNENLTRAEGRRVKKSDAVKSPASRKILGAAKKMGLSARVEEKSHPSHWLSAEGRVVVEWEGSKEELIKNIAGRLAPK